MVQERGVKAVECLAEIHDGADTLFPQTNELILLFLTFRELVDLAEYILLTEQVDERNCGVADLNVIDRIDRSTSLFLASMTSCHS